MAKQKDTAAKASTTDEIDVLDVQRGRIDVCVLGSTGYISNRCSQKAQRQLLLPATKKNATERATTLKHNPFEEYRASPYRDANSNGPTVIQCKASAFKKAMMGAALDLPGTKKAQIGRLISVDGEYVSLFGVPKLSMMIVRSADMNRTPDVRTRAIQPAWACRLRITFVQPLIKAQAVIRLLAAAGLYIGVGDGRNEKGALTYGGFELVEPDHPEFTRLLAEGGRTVQLAAFEHPEPYDEETAEMLTWFDAEVGRRQMRGIA